MFFKSWGMALGCLISGILIDLDHIFDYVREHGWSFDIKKFFHIHNTAQYNRIILFWHGWEWLILWGIIAWLTDWNPWAVGILIGISQHMALDSIANGLDLRSYSILWRWKHKFHFDTVFPEWKKIKYKHRQPPHN
jgi:hypothetical protein